MWSLESSAEFYADHIFWERCGTNSRVTKFKSSVTFANAILSYTHDIKCIQVGVVLLFGLCNSEISSECVCNKLHQNTL